MADIFLSYSSADRERIRPLVKILEEQGWSVWWDRKIPPGKTWHQIIEQALDESRCVVVVWSQHSIQSDWVITEAEEGKDRQALIPVLIDDVKAPLAFRRIQAARLVGWQGEALHPEVEMLVESVAKIMEVGRLKGEGETEQEGEILVQTIAEREIPVVDEAIVSVESPFQEFDPATAEMEEAEHEEGQLSDQASTITTIPPLYAAPLQHTAVDLNLADAKFQDRDGEDKNQPQQTMVDHASAGVDEDSENRGQSHIINETSIHSSPNVLPLERRANIDDQKSSFSPVPLSATLAAKQKLNLNFKQWLTVGGGGIVIVLGVAVILGGWFRWGNSWPLTSKFEFTVATVDARGSAAKRVEASQQFVEYVNGVKLEMVQVPGGMFTMGSPNKEVGRSSSEGPQHQVTIKPFWMGKYEITQAQWQAVIKLPKVNIEDLGKYFQLQDDNLPIQAVSWYEAQEFCRRLSRETGRDYRLPSEAEWEYAARAGTNTPFAFGPTITPEIVNYNGNYPYGAAPKGKYLQRPIPVGSLGVANTFGLFDMGAALLETCRCHLFSTV